MRHTQVLTETLNFLTASVQDFGLAAFDVPALLDWAKADLGSAVAATRTAAISMVRRRVGHCRRTPRAAALHTSFSVHLHPHPQHTHTHTHTHT